MQFNFFKDYQNVKQSKSKVDLILKLAAAGMVVVVLAVVLMEVVKYKLTEGLVQEMKTELQSPQMTQDLEAVRQLESDIAAANIFHNANLMITLLQTVVTDMDSETYRTMAGCLPPDVAIQSIEILKDKSIKITGIARGSAAVGKFQSNLQDSSLGTEIGNIVTVTAINSSTEELCEFYVTINRQG